MSNVLQASNLSSLEALHAELDALTHPFAKLFPLISEQELAELATDIEANGLREPIAKTVDGRIADGRNRWLACKLTDQEPTYVTLKDGTDLLSFIVSKNLRRRHLSTSQRAAIAAEIANLPPGGSANLPSPISQPQAAELMKVSTRSVGKAKKVKKVSAALHEAIKADKITPDAAEQIVDIKDANVRQEAITAVVTGDPAAAKAITKKTQDPKRHTTPYVYSDVLTALEGLPKRLRKFPPDAHVYGQLAEAFTAAIADLRAYEQTLTTSEPANDA